METYRPSLGSIEYQDHTADLWVKANGSDIETVIAELVHGIYGVMAGSFDIDGETDDFLIESEGPDAETAMVDLLNEVLFLFDAESKIIVDHSITILNEDDKIFMKLQGNGRIVSIPPGEGGMEVKAVTYHGATIERDGEITICRILLDL